MLDGGAAADVLTGGAGADQMTGGLGSDLFVIGALADLAAGETIDASSISTGRIDVDGTNLQGGDTIVGSGNADVIDRDSAGDRDLRPNP